MGARTGGRSQRVVSDVLRAALDELNRGGYGALRVEDVAARASVNKTTVYRRWPTKADLVTAAIRAFAGYDEPLPDTGSIRGDLREMVLRTIQFCQTPEGQALTRFVTMETGDPEVDRLVRSLRDASTERRRLLVERAIARGELPAGIDTRLIVDAVFAPITSRVVRLREPVDPATAEVLIDLVITGVENGAGRSRRGHPTSERDGS